MEPSPKNNFLSTLPVRGRFPRGTSTTARPTARPSQSRAGRHLTWDSPVTDTLEKAGAHHYSIDLEANEQLRVELMVLEGDRPPEIRLFSPDGTQVGSPHWEGDGKLLRKDFVAPRLGRHVVVIGTARRRARVSYAVAVYRPVPLPWEPPRLWAEPPEEHPTTAQTSAPVSRPLYDVPDNSIPTLGKPSPSMTLPTEEAPWQEPPWLFENEQSMDEDGLPTEETPWARRPPTTSGANPIEHALDDCRDFCEDTIQSWIKTLHPH